jgi:hypothetical protein
MIVDDFNVGWACLAFVPPKADAPLVIYSDAPLALSIADEFFQPVTTQGGQVPKTRRRF